MDRPDPSAFEEDHPKRTVTLTAKKMWLMLMGAFVLGGVYAWIILASVWNGARGW